MKLNKNLSFFLGILTGYASAFAWSYFEYKKTLGGIIAVVLVCAFVGLFVFFTED